MKYQNGLGRAASTAEAIAALATWEDNRATMLLLGGCAVCIVCLLTIELRWILRIIGVFLMRPPFLRRGINPLANFISRLPTRQHELALLIGYRKS